MSPFLQFRSWATRGPSAERALTLSLVVVLAAVLVWAGTPSVGGPAAGGDDLLASEAGQLPGEAAAPGAAVAGTAPGAAVTGGGTGTAPAAGSSTTNGSGSGSGSSAVSGGAASGSGGTAAAGTPGRPAGTASTSAGCGPQTATDQGVTAKDITVGVVTVDLGALGDLIDLPSTEELRRAYNAVIEDLNAKGGVRCRKLVPRYYVDSGLDQNQQHAACLQMQEDKVFAVFNNLFSPAESTCVAKAKIPNIWYTAPHTPDVKRYAPYVLSWQPDYDQLIQHYVRGAKSLGWFKGMTKLGILERTCYPDEIAALVKELSGAGFDPGAASRFSYGCPAANPTPEQQQAAALQFKRDGVTHVLNVAYSDDGAFSRAADQQDFKPRFAHMEDASATAIQTGTEKPGNSFDGTLLISTIETGARTTPGYKYNAATLECARILKRAGLPAPYEEPSALYFGVACINVSMFKQMAERAPELVRTQLATGLASSGQLELSFPAGPVKIADAARPTGGQLWRPGAWLTSCQCWRVTDVRYRPGY